MGLEGGHLLGEREVPQVRTAYQQQICAVFGGHGTGLHEGGLVGGVGVQQHRKQCPPLLDFGIQTEFGLSWFHKNPFAKVASIIKIQKTGGARLLLYLWHGVFHED